MGGSFSYRPSVPVAFVAQQLAFPADGGDKCVEWLAGFEGLVYAPEAGSTKQVAVPTKTALLDCKNSAATSL